jgi:hypothetical protein
MKVKDFAKLAGVSPSTISKIIHNNDQNISVETKERVLKLAKSSGFHLLQNAGAQNSRLLLAILLKNFSSFYQLRYIVELMQERGYQCLIASSQNSKSEEQRQLNLFQSMGASVVLWEPLDLKNNQSILDLNNIPFLLFNHIGDRALTLNYESLSYFLTETLIKMGHRKITCLAPKNSFQKDFISGYSNCLIDNAIKVSTELILEDVQDFKAKIYQMNSSAVISSSYAELTAIYYYLLQQAYNIPIDFSLLSLADENDTVIDSLSTVQIPRKKFSDFCVDALVKLTEKQSVASFVFNPILELTSEVSIQEKTNKDVTKVIVVGSINVDHYLSFKKLPCSGTTTITDKSSIYPGGKCLNQSIGLIRLGLSPIPMAGIGSDTEASKILDYLYKEKINISGIKKFDKVQTGQAQIFLQEDGESMITIMSGANSYLSPEDILAREVLFSNAKFCILQSEVPISTIQKACEIAKQKNITTALKPSTKPNIPSSLFPLLDFIIPNQNEILEIVPCAKSYQEAALELLNSGVGTVIVTLGSAGAYIRNSKINMTIPAPNVPVIDATGASDAFISAFIASLSKNYTLIKAVNIANCAAALSIGKQGVSPSLVTEKELETFLPKVPLLL